MLKGFWGHVDCSGGPDACWLYGGSTDAGGYGVTYVHKRPIKAHRFSWEIHRGDILEGFFVLHDCDIRYAPGDVAYRKCVNPGHLRLGTSSDNNQDAWRKGRNLTIGERTTGKPALHAQGERNHNAKLQAADVRAIRSRWESGELRSVLAAEYGVSWTVLDGIVKRKTWRHL